jgi:hypothetical protein
MNYDDGSEDFMEVFGPWEPPSLDHFAASRLKIQRAKKHIDDIKALLVAFTKSDFYTVSVEKNVERRTNYLRFDVEKLPFPFYDAALLVGDTLHNLRSALDLVYYGMVSNPTKWTRFPIFDTRETLVGALNTALKKKQISQDIYDLVLNTIQPYYAGNYSLWALHDLNIRDKHQLLVPVVKFLQFMGVCLEDDKHRPVNPGKIYIMDASSRIRLPPNVNITLKEKGHATAVVLFDFGTPFDAQPVVPSLTGIAEEVTRTVKAFELLSGGIRDGADTHP